jgi:hypothetical protein
VFDAAHPPHTEVVWELYVEVLGGIGLAASPSPQTFATPPPFHMFRVSQRVRPRKRGRPECCPRSAEGPLWTL